MDDEAVPCSGRNDSFVLRLEKARLWMVEKGWMDGLLFRPLQKTRKVGHPSIGGGIRVTQRMGEFLNGYVGREDGLGRWVGGL